VSLKKIRNNQALKVQFSMILLAGLLACNERRNTSARPAGDENDDISARSTGQASNYLVVFPKDTQLRYQDVHITLPAGWGQGVHDLQAMKDATFRYQYHNKNGKPVYLEYGLGTRGNPAEPYVAPANRRPGYMRHDADTSGLVFTDDRRLPEMRRKSDYIFHTERVSSLRATFFRPKQIGKGYTGIFIDSIGHAGLNIADLVIYTADLDGLEIEELMKVIKSLVIKGFMRSQ
jgi:hypothetical protein